MKIYTLKREPPQTLQVNGQTYYYQWSTPHMSNIIPWVKEYGGRLFIRVCKWQKRGWADKRKKLRYRPSYYIYIRRKVTKEAPDWYYKHRQKRR